MVCLKAQRRSKANLGVAAELAANEDVGWPSLLSMFVNVQLHY